MVKYGGFSPGDVVRVKHTGAEGIVTYPGRTGFPFRVYVRHDGRTAHYAPDEVEEVEDA